MTYVYAFVAFLIVFFLVRHIIYRRTAGATAAVARTTATPLPTATPGATPAAAPAAGAATPATPPARYTEWLTWGQGLAITAIKEGAAVIVALTVVIVGYTLLWIERPDMMAGYEANNGAIWGAVVIILLMSIAAAFTKGTVRRVLLVPLVIVLGFIVGLPLFYTATGMGGVDVTQTLIAHGCDEKPWVGVPLTSTPTPLPDCRSSFSVTAAAVVEGDDGNDVDALPGKAVALAPGVRALSIRAVTPGAKVSGVFCPEERPYWDTKKNHCVASTT